MRLRLSCLPEEYAPSALFMRRAGGGKEESMKMMEGRRIMFRVKGLVAGGRTDALREALRSGAEELALEPEPENPYHQNAIRVFLCRGERRWHIGYVPRELADEVGGDAGSIRVTLWEPLYYNRLPSGLQVAAVIRKRKEEMAGV